MVTSVIFDLKEHPHNHASVTLKALVWTQQQWCHIPMQQDIAAAYKHKRSSFTFTP